MASFATTTVTIIPPSKQIQPEPEPGPFRAAAQAVHCCWWALL